jgi:hypothetical protein
MEVYASSPSSLWKSLSPLLLPDATLPTYQSILPFTSTAFNCGARIELLHTLLHAYIAQLPSIQPPRKPALYDPLYLFNTEFMTQFSHNTCHPLITASIHTTRTFTSSSEEISTHPVPHNKHPWWGVGMYSLEGEIICGAVARIRDWSCEGRDYASNAASKAWATDEDKVKEVEIKLEWEIQLLKDNMPSWETIVNALQWQADIEKVRFHKVFGRLMDSTILRQNPVLFSGVCKSENICYTPLRYAPREDVLRCQLFNYICSLGPTSLSEANKEFIVFSKQPHWFAVQNLPDHGMAFLIQTQDKTLREKSHCRGFKDLPFSLRLVTAKLVDFSAGQDQGTELSFVFEDQSVEWETTLMNEEIWEKILLRLKGMMEPWDENGRLKPIWGQLLDARIGNWADHPKFEMDISQWIELVP